ncbi:hypothetical protein FOZ60_015348 [Perkinsus olseni]|uniref:RNase H type-1 domain-containing protein n=1 Tax=Perkinsus olseni TaxID=32597 RepID=A0A7J6P5W0_PEROL|nr:hypothetical protein FOZ60_015348 [Perkinsus olseni]
MTSGMPPRPDNSAHYFYSDGSVVDRGNVVAKTGTGVVRLVSGHQSGHEGRCYNTGPHANILQCEAVGLWAAMSWALELRMQGDPRKTVYLCCDSQAAIRSVANVLRHSDRASTELTREVAGLIRRWIGQGTDGYQTYLWWVKGHVGHRFNELSDLYAGRAARSGPSTHRREVELPASFTRAQIIHHARVDMEERWRRQRCRLAIHRLGLGFGRRQLTGIVRTGISWRVEDRRHLFELLTFHSSTRGYLRHISADVTDWKCRYCRAHKEELSHFFWCSSRRMSRLRAKIWGGDPLSNTLPGERPKRGLNLIRGSLTAARGSGCYTLRKFLRASAPPWGRKASVAGRS